MQRYEKPKEAYIRAGNVYYRGSCTFYRTSFTDMLHGIYGKRYVSTLRIKPVSGDILSRLWRKQGVKGFFYRTFSHFVLLSSAGDVYGGDIYSVYDFPDPSDMQQGAHSGHQISLLVSVWSGDCDCCELSVEKSIKICIWNYFDVKKVLPFYIDHSGGKEFIIMDGQNFNNGYEQQPVYQQPVQQMPQQPYQEPRKAHGLSIAGLVVGIIAIVSSCVLSWISALIGAVALILAIIGQVKNKSGLGLAAIIVSAAGIVCGVVFFFVYAYVLVSAGNVFGYY